MDILNAHDIVLTGIPRGGTTLACQLLGTAADTLALFEPMPVHELPLQHESALAEVVDYFGRVRQQALSLGRVPSKQRAGKVPDNPYGDRDDAVGVRPWLAGLGEIAVDKPLSPSFRLVIKHNSAFVALLPALATRYPVIGVLRNPLAVLASWRSVDLSVSHGCLPAGERLDPALAAALAAQPDLLRRQVLLVDWFFDRLQKWVSPARLIRYEDTVIEGGAGLLQAAGVAVTTAAPAHLRSRNLNPQYAADEVATLVAALREHATACWHSYPLEEVQALAAGMCRGLVGDA